MKEGLPQLCGNCNYWRKEPAALDAHHRQLLRDTSGLPEGRDLEFGYCSAAFFISKEGKTIFHKPSKAGGQPCVEHGSDGELLFAPVPED